MPSRGFRGSAWWCVNMPTLRDGMGRPSWQWRYRDHGQTKWRRPQLRQQPLPNAWSFPSSRPPRLQSTHFQHITSRATTSVTSESPVQNGQFRLANTPTSATVASARRKKMPCDDSTPPKLTLNFVPQFLHFIAPLSGCSLLAARFVLQREPELTNTYPAKEVRTSPAKTAAL